MNWRAGPSFGAATPRTRFKEHDAARFIPERGSRPMFGWTGLPHTPRPSPRRGHHDVAEPEPVRHQAQLVAEGGAMSSGGAASSGWIEWTMRRPVARSALRSTRATMFSPSTKGRQ